MARVTSYGLVPAETFDRELPDDPGGRLAGPAGREARSRSPLSYTVSRGMSGQLSGETAAVGVRLHVPGRARMNVYSVRSRSYRSASQ
jgi:hypothetical protein